MQCPIPVQGRECGAEARTHSASIAHWDDAIAIHFHCLQGHRFHIGPRERWQMCRCHAQEKTLMDDGRLSGVHHDMDTLLMTLAAQKDIQVIVPDKTFKL